MLLAGARLASEKYPQKNCPRALMATHGQFGAERLLVAETLAFDFEEIGTKGPDP